MAPDRVDEAVARGDLDELLRLVDSGCDAGDWEALASLRERSAAAYRESGRQLWPAAAYAAYRLALEAPAPFAASVLVDDGARFTLGPLPEVAAQDHAWRELAPHAPPGATAVLAVHERVVRGEDLSDAELPGPPVLELPQHLERWEPRYALAEYRPHDADFPAPSLPALETIELPPSVPRLAADEGTTALTDLVRTWTVGSDGRVDVAVVEGGALDAIAAIGPPVGRVARLAPAEALAAMAWAAASGGAHGRRAGAAAGRFATWWTLAALGGLLDEWPVAPPALGAAAGGLGWLAWDAGDPSTGWRLYLAVEDPGRDRAWAIAAVDAA